MGKEIYLNLPLFYYLSEKYEREKKGRT